MRRGLGFGEAGFRGLLIGLAQASALLTNHIEPGKAHARAVQMRRERLPDGHDGGCDGLRRLAAQCAVDGTDLGRLDSTASSSPRPAAVSRPRPSLHTFQQTNPLDR